MPILIARDITSKVSDGDILSVDFTTGKIINKTKNTGINVKPFSKSQLDIYKNGGLLKK
jgi:3-isopropylmalate/(R)-2-methylmalate dehydratase small subunit